jgi:hypothetical protein
MAPEKARAASVETRRGPIVQGHDESSPNDISHRQNLQLLIGVVPVAIPPRRPYSSGGA